MENAYWLELPAAFMKIYLVFSLDKQQKAVNNPLPGQIQGPPSLIEIDANKSGR